VDRRGTAVAFRPCGSLVHVAPATLKILAQRATPQLMPGLDRQLLLHRCQDTQAACKPRVTLQGRLQQPLTTQDQHPDDAGPSRIGNPLLQLPGDLDHHMRITEAGQAITQALQSQVGSLDVQRCVLQQRQQGPQSADGLARGMDGRVQVGCRRQRRSDRGTLMQRSLAKGLAGFCCGHRCSLPGWEPQCSLLPVGHRHHAAVTRRCLDLRPFARADPATLAQHPSSRSRST